MRAQHVPAAAPPTDQGVAGPKKNMCCEMHTGPLAKQTTQCRCIAVIKWLYIVVTTQFNENMVCVNIMGMCVGYVVKRQINELS